MSLLHLSNMNQIILIKKDCGDSAIERLNINKKGKNIPRTIFS